MKIFAVGVGKGIDHEELKTIALDIESNVLEVEDVNHLDEKLRKILQASCPQ